MISDYFSFQSIDVLKSNGITDVFNVAEGKGFGSCGVFDPAPYQAAGLTYHGMLIRDNVDAKDDGKQKALFSQAADTIETILSKVTFKITILLILYVYYFRREVVSWSIALVVSPGLPVQFCLTCS